MRSSYYPLGVKEDSDFEKIENKKFLLDLYSRGWNYDKEDNFYLKEINGINYHIGLSWMADDNLWGEVFTRPGVKIGRVNNYRKLLEIIYNNDQQ